MNLNARNISIIVGALLILGAGIYFVQESNQKKDQAGKSALYSVQLTYEGELNAVPENERAAGSQIDVDAKFPKTVSSINEMLASKSAPPRTLFEAAMKLGNLYLDHGKPEKALPAFKQMADHAKTNLQKASAQYLLGVAYERANQLKEAQDAYQKGSSSDVDGLKGEMMLGVVRVSLKLNDKEKAKLYSEKLNKDLPGSSSARAAADLVSPSK